MYKQPFSFKGKIFDSPFCHFFNLFSHCRSNRAKNLKYCEMFLPIVNKIHYCALYFCIMSSNIFYSSIFSYYTKYFFWNIIPLSCNHLFCCAKHFFDYRFHLNLTSIQDTFLVPNLPFSVGPLTPTLFGILPNPL